MKLTTVRLKNYKSFRDSGVITLSPHINVVVGRNNSGKSAFLQSFRFNRMVNTPHKDPSRSIGLALDPLSSIDFSIKFDAGEYFEEIKLDHELFNITVAVPAGWSIDQAFGAYLEKATEMSFSAMAGRSPIVPKRNPAHQLFQPGDGSEQFATLKIDRSNLAMSIGSHSVSGADDTPGLIEQVLSRRVYVFNPERYNIGASGISDTRTLAPDGSNLPSVLAKLFNNDLRKEQYISDVRKIIPEIHTVNVTTLGSNQVQVLVYFSDTPREDLAITLDQCGTGLSQVLSIVYVMQEMRAGVIVIDEPNAFLHPGAAKQLMRLMNRYDNHQFIISTHSTEVISALNVGNLYIVSNKEYESSVSWTSNKSSNLRDVLWEVGASLADVFGSDAIVWVEGPTEERCFGIIYNGFDVGVESRVTFVPVVAVSHFERRGKTAEEVWSVYEALVVGRPLLGPTVAFSFDRELRSDSKIADLVRASKNKAKFLPRRMYENYIIHPAAIAQSLTELSGEHVAEQAIIDWVRANDAVGLDSEKARRNPKEFRDAARFLHAMYSEISDGKVEFSKVRDCSTITMWILANDPDFLEELVQYVRTLVS